MKRLPFFCLFCLSFAFFVCHPAMADSPTQLKKLTSKIADIKAALSQDQNKRSRYLRALKEAEINSGKAQRKLKQIKQNLRDQKQVLARLNENEERYKNELAHQQQKFSEQVRMIYLLGRQPYLKLLLNQSDINQMSRILTYYNYISQSQITTIYALQETLEKLKLNQDRILAQTKKSKVLKSQQEHERQKLTQVAKNRQRIIKKINAKIHTKNEKLATLLDNKKLLEKALTRLAQQDKTSSATSFTHEQGRLPWPTRGRVLPYFGTPIQHSELTWSGILIRAKEDQPVRAIAPGKVVFAKWMPGYGLLLIIDHGKGYMSLYGRNHNLYKKPGDIVKRGELIATVGQSGGYQQPALYFAIRHNAKALNPVKWCTNNA